MTWTENSIHILIEIAHTHSNFVIVYITRHTESRIKCQILSDIMQILAAGAMLCCLCDFSRIAEDFVVIVVFRDAILTPGSNDIWCNYFLQFHLCCETNHGSPL